MCANFKGGTSGGGGLARLVAWKGAGLRGHVFFSVCIQRNVSDWCDARPARETNYCGQPSNPGLPTNPSKRNRRGPKKRPTQPPTASDETQSGQAEDDVVKGVFANPVLLLAFLQSLGREKGGR